MPARSALAPAKNPAVVMVQAPTHPVEVWVASEKVADEVVPAAVHANVRSGIVAWNCPLRLAWAPKVTLSVPVKVPGAVDPSVYVGRLAPASVYVPPPVVGRTGVGSPTT